MVDSLTRPGIVSTMKVLMEVCTNLRFFDGRYMQAQINGYGVSVRDARLAAGELQQFVGAVVELVYPPAPEPEV